MIGYGESIEEMLLAVLSRDVSMLATLIKRVGRTPPRLDDSLLSIDVADLVANYGSQSLENFDLAGALNDVTDIMGHRSGRTLDALGLRDWSVRRAAGTF